MWAARAAHLRPALPCMAAGGRYNVTIVVPVKGKLRSQRGASIDEAMMRKSSGPWCSSRSPRRRGSEGRVVSVTLMHLAGVEAAEAAQGRAPQQQQAAVGRGVGAGSGSSASTSASTSSGADGSSAPMSSDSRVSDSRVSSRSSASEEGSGSGARAQLGPLQSPCVWRQADAQRAMWGVHDVVGSVRGACAGAQPSLKHK